MHKKADARLHFRMLLLSSPSPFCELNMVQTVGAMDKAPGARKSRAPADQARQRAQAAKSAGGAATISEAERFTQGGPAPRLPPLPLPRRLRLCRALQMPATVRWQPPPSVTDDADDAFAAKAVLVAAAAAAPVVNDAVAASCLRASSRSWINYTPKHDDPGASSEV